VPSTGISIIWAGVAASFVAAVASITSARIARQIKISEFRQAWIDDLRKDIADYSGVAEEWFQKYTELNNPNADHDEKVRRIRTELMPVANKSLVILRRVQLRFNARDDNPDKAEDDAFLASLVALIDPGKLDPRHIGQSWEKLADDAVSRGRVILKREWEVVKHPFRHWVKRRWLSSRAHLLSARRDDRNKTASPQMAFDSAGDLLAATPVLVAIANWTGKLGRIYIKDLLRTGKDKEARRNATIMVAVAITMFLLLIGCVVWLAKL
jgi:hypothetical protein